MTRLLQSLRARLDRRTRRWVLRRQGQDADPVTLRRNRIYILPTRLGVAYGAMLFAMLLGGMNYNNNLGLGLTFLLVGLGLVTMHHCHGTLSGLRLRLLAAESGFVGDTVRFRWLLENDSKLSRPAIEVRLERIGGARGRPLEVPALGTAEACLAIAATRRGRVALERFVVSTAHPLGFFRAWAVVHPTHAAVAWPQPAGRDRAPPRTATDTGAAQFSSAGDDDFAGLRPFVAGDSLRRVAWKAYARGQGLHTMQYAGTDVVSHLFEWDALPGLGTEERLAQLCRWVLDAHDRGEAFGLRLPASTSASTLGWRTASGASMRSRCSTRRTRSMAEPASGARIGTPPRTGPRLDRRPPASARNSPSLHGLTWVLTALGVAVVPHVPFLPAWVALLLLAVGVWRWTAARHGWPLAPRWLRIVIVVVATTAVLGTYRTINGIEAGTTFLVLMAAAKLLETRAARDLTVLVFIALFLLYTALLRNQALLQLPWLLLSAFLTIVALMRVHAEETDAPGASLARRTLALMAQAIPVAIALFLLFPRLPGPIWGFETQSEARTGLDDEMTPGDVSDLSASGEVAFRVRFNGDMPAPEQPYWRGPVLHEFDGRSWRRPRGQEFPRQSVVFGGEPIRYRITLEPHARR
jgi:uncharacterized protein (DUF58 family)